MKRKVITYLYYYIDFLNGLTEDCDMFNIALAKVETFRKHHITKNIESFIDGSMRVLSDNEREFIFLLNGMKYGVTIKSKEITKEI